jgi:hypothetical protein
MRSGIFLPFSVVTGRSFPTIFRQLSDGLIKIKSSITGNRSSNLWDYNPLLYHCAIVTINYLVRNVIRFVSNLCTFVNTVFFFVSTVLSFVSNVLTFVNIVFSFVSTLFTFISTVFFSLTILR